MQLGPILSAMRRNKVGAIVIAVQTAITLAILCNGLFIIEQRLVVSRRPTGTDEANLFAITNQWVGKPQDVSARVQTDLAALRSLSGVVDAISTNAYPLTNSGTAEGVTLSADQKDPTTVTAVYFADEHGLATLGLRLIAGRNFTVDEIGESGDESGHSPPGVIATRELADKLFPGEVALGRSFHLQEQDRGTPIIGIVEQLQIPFVGGRAARFNGNSILEPYRYVAQTSYYVVRARPGTLAALMKGAVDALLDVNRARVIQKVESFGAARHEIYRNERGLAVILGVVCAALLAVTAFGTVGLTSYWVTQRRRQIGIRRALGATRGAILNYFQVENLLIAASGAILGVAMALAVNLWMVSSFAMERLHAGYTIVGAVIVLALGQLAAIFPALRAASIPPALATRGA